jgi:hypothetical protein
MDEVVRIAPLQDDPGLIGYECPSFLQLRDQRVLEWIRRAQVTMTTLTLRYQRGHFTVSGPDIEIRKFKSRREAKDWCAQHYPGSPIEEFGADASKRASMKARKSKPPLELRCRCRD